MITAREVARAVKIAPGTKRFVLRDEYGSAYDGGRTEMVLAALSRSDRSEGLSMEVRGVAYALWKSITTCRMNPTVAMGMRTMSPYQVCGIVARVANECPETTTGGICDGWLPVHQHELIGAQA